MGTHGQTEGQIDHGNTLKSSKRAKGRNESRNLAEMPMQWQHWVGSGHVMMQVLGANKGANRMAWRWADTLVEIRGTLADIRGTTK